MLSPCQIKQLTELVHREVVPATGCTEPAAVALTVAYAASLLCPEDEPLHIEVLLSANMLKNALGVGIPGTGMFGIPIAIALGAGLAKPEKQLELLDCFSCEELEQAKRLVDSGVIDIKLKEGTDIDKLYVETLISSSAGHLARAVLARTHTGLCRLELDGQSQLTQVTERIASDEHPCDKQEETLKLSFDIVYEYALTAPLESIYFIYEAALQNKRASEYSLQHNCGHNLGKMMQSDLGKQFFGDTALAQMLTYTSSACDARMDGAPVTVMSNSGSGNQGISSMLPVLTFAERQGASEEQTARALMLSSLIVIYIKQELGRLSCLCGMVVSGVGTACALTYLLNGSKEQAIGAIKNMIGNVAGMICDGAKPSCSLKASTGVSSAMVAALLAMQGHVVTGNEGIVDEDIDCCIRNLAELGRDGMALTDQHVLKIMTSKKLKCTGH